MQPLLCIFSLELQKGKNEIRLCPQCGEFRRSVTSSDMNITLAFRLVTLLMHSFQHNTRIYHRTVHLNFCVSVTLFQNEFFHRNPSLFVSWQYRQRNKVKVYRRLFFLLVDKTAIKLRCRFNQSINQHNTTNYRVLISQCDVWDCSGEHISLKSGIIGDSRSLRSATGYIFVLYLAVVMMYRENAESCS
jgi:hypothetical protein